LRLASAIGLLIVFASSGFALAGPVRFEATLAPQATPPGPLTGRLLIAISKDTAAEPRLEIDEGYRSQQLFGVDVAASTQRTIVVDDRANGFPIERLTDLPPGDYLVQAVFNRYEQFHKGDGQALELPPDRGEGQHWNTKPGNPYSVPVRLHVAASGGVFPLLLDKTIPEVKTPDPDTPWLKHVHVKNQRLSAFWGRDVYLDAFVLLPQGWAEHPSAHYPVVIYQDHFSPRFRALGGWSEAPPAAGLSGAELDRARAAWAHYQHWTSGLMAKVIVIEVNHPNPFYDDSYAVNSVNIGPYGDAISLDLIPDLERRFRGMGAGWARDLWRLDRRLGGLGDANLLSRRLQRGLGFVSGSG
jgi:hypothetical protein